MELIDSRKEQTEAWAFRVCVALCCLSLVAGLVLLCFILAGPKRISVDPLPLPEVNVEKIGEGPLSLQGYSALSDILFVGASTRPDTPLLLTFATRSSGKSWTVKVGEEVVLQETTFAPRTLENGVAVCTLANGTEVRFAPSMYFTEPVAEKPYYKTLQAGAVWPQDRFLSGWGGDEMRELAKQTKVCVGEALFFLRCGQCLGWNGEKWVSETQEGMPLAQLVRSVNGAEFQVWDESGFTVERVRLPLKGNGEFLFDLGAYMSAPRLRSKLEVSCLLGKRRVVIREGDWWIRTDEKWRQIRTAADFEAVLYHRLAGELCLFETVEVLQAKVVIRGHVFDRMRGAVCPLSWSAP